MNKNVGMNWKHIITALEARGMTHNQIAEAAGLASGGHTSNIKAGRQTSLKWEAGERLLLLYNPRLKPRRDAK